VAILLHLHRAGNGWHRFRIGDNGDPTEFKIAVLRLKEMIPLGQRRWVREIAFWEVAPTLDNERALYAIFENGPRHFPLKTQLRLF